MNRYSNFLEKIIEDYNKKYNIYYKVEFYSITILLNSFNNKYNGAKNIKDLYLHLFYIYGGHYSELFTDIYFPKDYIVGKG